ncbi:MAG: M14 family metallopeptidase [Xanthomonadales bacterium]|nr:M14 family metallopeptidase [Gammaproteobacteria bacterium]NNE06807.1 M14 family metallopeptidase [Xanthomonadales bacterium]NNL94498.1 M14 family metallopeptidase [Xanthomonadales bacterium]
MSRQVQLAAVLFCILAVACFPRAQAEPGSEALPERLFNTYEQFLPPQQAWSGRSESLLVDASHPWVTPAELGKLTATPSYDETIAWLSRLVAAAPELSMVSIGKSHQGRDVWMVIASQAKEHTPAGLAASGKPLLLAQAGIHSGEIDGKDAGLMLLRDMTVRNTRRDLLDLANLLFVPILNVDGHENSSRYARINQRGPLEMGWRTNARNQNLNRDYAKLDTPGVRAIVEVIKLWQPHLYLDLHVTDGADYQYDITFGGNGKGGWSPEISSWISGSYTEFVNQELARYGHIPGPLILATNGRDMDAGYYVWTADPRYSNAYGDARHLPTVLVENHSLKPYRQRVLGTYVMLEASMRVMAAQFEAVQSAISMDRSRRPDNVTLGWLPNPESAAPHPFLGIRHETYQGQVSGGPVVRWTGEKVDSPVVQVDIDIPSTRVTRPEAYLIPVQWREIAGRLSMHGIPVETLQEPLTTEVEIYRLPDAAIAKPAGWTPNPFEGRVRIDPGKPVTEHATVTLPPGSFRVPTDHELGELVSLLLEPEAADSFFQWGFFLEIFTRTEYAEPYVLEPLAQKLLELDENLVEQFQQRLDSDPEFAADPARRLMWIYSQTPFYDQQYRVYPVLRSVGDRSLTKD